jgi:hypothetical protein
MVGVVAGHMVATVSTPELGILLHAPDSLEQPLGVYGAGDCHPLVVYIAHHLIHTCTYSYNQGSAYNPEDMQNLHFTREECSDLS